jgi:hypothetical protein
MLEESLPMFSFVTESEERIMLKVQARERDQRGCQASEDLKYIPPYIFQYAEVHPQLLFLFPVT